MSDILVIDDESDIRYILSDILEDEGYTVSLAHNIATALEKVNASVPKAVILDIWLEGSANDGIGLLKLIKRKYPMVPVIMISGHGNIKTAVQTIKMGAYDFIEKPFKTEKLLILLQRALESSKLSIANQKLRKNTKLVGNSEHTNRLKEYITKATKHCKPVLVYGEKGVGKETVASVIHHYSSRKGGPFTKVNLEGCKQKEVGLGDFFSEAISDCQGGTIYLYNVNGSLMDPKTKSHLIKLLNNKDIRVIVSSESKEKCSSLGEVFNDVINVLPLRERKDDVLPLANHFISDFTENGAEYTLSDAVLATLLNYSWPGNVKQLRNVVEWLVMFACSQASVISMEMMPKELVENVNKTYHSINPVNTSMIAKPLKEAREIFEKEYLQAQLKRFSGNIAKTAGFIGMDRTALHRKLKLLNIPVNRGNDSKSA